MNDPVADFLTRIRNAIRVNKDTARIPYSNLKLSLAKVLQEEGYINGFNVVDEDQAAKKAIEVVLKYTANGMPVISNLRRVSRPGLRKYCKASEAPRVFNGLGISVISTSTGLITDRKARHNNVGGEVLCQVW